MVAAKKLAGMVSSVVGSGYFKDWLTEEGGENLVEAIKSGKAESYDDGYGENERDIEEGETAQKGFFEWSGENELTSLEVIRSDRTSDGDHDGWEAVIECRTKDGLQYFAVYGYYSSDYGVDFDDLFDFQEVMPVQVTTIEYRQKIDI